MAVLVFAQMLPATIGLFTPSTQITSSK